MEPASTRDSHPNLFFMLLPWKKNVLLSCCSYCCPSDKTCNILIGATDTDIHCFLLLLLLNRTTEAGLDGTHLMTCLKHIQTKPFPPTPKQQESKRSKLFFCLGASRGIGIYAALVGFRHHRIASLEIQAHGISEL